MIQELYTRTINLLPITFVLLTFTIIAQIDPQIQKYRDDSYGNPAIRREAVMDRNQIRTLFRNDGQIGSWPLRPSGEWPKGTGHHYIDGGTPIISSRLETAAGIVHPAATSYREWVDLDPQTDKRWVMEPIPGYSNPNSSKPAMSNDQSSWPSVWPAALNLSDKWNGHWYGYFGRDVFNADLEIFYVMDDSQDKEYYKSPYSFFPVITDSERAGLGLRVEVRGFQWSKKLFENIIYWHYDIINISDFDRDSTIFGFYCDPGVGGAEDNGDDNANCNTKLDLFYAFDNDGVAPPNGWKTGYVGYAFLESPGNSINGIDDDMDGMVDESRDDGIDNDGDWIAFSDINGNGKWDVNENEPLNDDVGADGISPVDSQYTGPDSGEGDGLPTLGEPNFDKTDIDESDQIGLTSLSTELLGYWGPNSLWPKNDEYIWFKMTAGTFDTTIQNANIHVLFGSGSFPLKLYQRERFSFCLLFGEDLEDIIINKNIAQTIYNNNYMAPDSLTSIDNNDLELGLDNFELLQNYPNPFNPTTTINYQIKEDGLVTLKLYDILGSEIKTLVNEDKIKGRYAYNFNGSELASGVYIYQLRVNDFVSSKKLMMVK